MFASGVNLKGSLPEVKKLILEKFEKALL